MTKKKKTDQELTRSKAPLTEAGSALSVSFVDATKRLLTDLLLVAEGGESPLLLSNEARRSALVFAHFNGAICREMLIPAAMYGDEGEEKRRRREQE